MSNEVTSSQNPAGSSRFKNLFRGKQRQSMGGVGSVLRRFAFNLLLGIIVFALAILLGNTGPTRASTS